MFCPYCGMNMPEDAAFCQHCGRQQLVAARAQARESVRLSPSNSPPAGPSLAERAVSSASPQSSQLPHLSDSAVNTAWPPFFSKVGEALATLSSPKGDPSPPVEGPVQTQAAAQGPQRMGPDHQIVVAFPEDMPNRVVLGGLAAVLLGFFLPWVHLHFSGFFGIGATETDWSAISGGVLAWLLVVVLMALGAFVLCQAWLYRSQPQTPRWLLVMPLVIGTFMTAVSLSTIVLVLSLQNKLAEIGGDQAAGLFTTQFGVYLVLLGGITLAVGGYLKLVREHGAL